MSISTIYDYTDAGYRTFALHSITPNGCDCGDQFCKNTGKHPRTSAWQHSPNWSHEQIDAMIDADFITTGFGVVVDGFLVVDIDPRNGGDLKLAQSLPKTFTVATGGGGLHLYYALPDKTKAYQQKLIQYPGIDFKTSGFIVGAGSMHISGAEYEIQAGDLSSLSQAPIDLLNQLEKKSHYRGITNNQTIDVSDDDLQTMLKHINPDSNYEIWIACGMALHHTTGGLGIDIFDAWSSRGKKYQGRDDIDRHWHSFGKSSNVVTLGTLYYHAEQGGYTRPATVDIEPLDWQSPIPDEVKNHDFTRPPGFAGELASWINSQCLFPREHLAAASALWALGSIAGLRYTDDRDITLNLFVFCTAGSGSGKNSVEEAVKEILRIAAMDKCQYSKIKSEQEITRNLLEHQASFYLIDEIGLYLQKVANASKSGGASYLQGIIGELMSIYSKANGYFQLGGDSKRDLRDHLAKQISNLTKKIEANEDKSGALKLLVEQKENLASQVDSGIKNPFLSLLGFSTEKEFDDSVTEQTATNGFYARALIVREKETNPKEKKDFKKQPMPERMAHILRGISNIQNDFDIWQFGPKKQIQTTEAARLRLAQCSEWFHEFAERQKASTGLEAIPRRGAELVRKISAILALPEAIRDDIHVCWAWGMVEADIRSRINLTQSTEMASSKRSDDIGQAIATRIIDICGRDGERESVILQRCSRNKKFDKNDIKIIFDNLVNNRTIEKVEEKGKTKKFVRFRVS